MKKLRMLRVFVEEEYVVDLIRMHEQIEKGRLSVTVEIKPDELEPYMDAAKDAFISLLVAAKREGRVN